MVRIFILFCGFFIWTGCASDTEVSKLSEDGWVVVHRKFYGGLYYCRANKSTDGKAVPVCFEANFKEVKRCQSLFGCKDPESVGILPESKNEVALPKQ